MFLAEFVMSGHGGVEGQTCLYHVDGDMSVEISLTRRMTPVRCLQNPNNSASLIGSSSGGERGVTGLSWTAQGDTVSLSRLHGTNHHTFANIDIVIFALLSQFDIVGLNQ